mmetsp:Transcript_115733/g.332450  ORF Transcript_115733/g.332450 Transcript_115733/m.332450 type:complete len:246 (-) Transcript_115733:480-1217(-)
MNTTFFACKTTRPSSNSTHCGVAGLHVSNARSPCFISKAATSRASHTSPSPATKCIVFGPVKPYKGSAPSVADSTRNFTFAASGTTAAVTPPAVSTFFIRDLSCATEMSLTSKIRTSSTSSVPLAYRLSDGTASRSTKTEAFSPSVIDRRAVTTIRDNGPKMGSPTTCSISLCSSRISCLRLVNFTLTTTSSPLAGLRSPQPAFLTVLTASVSPNRSSCVCQPRSSTSKIIVALGGISGGDPSSS